MGFEVGDVRENYLPTDWKSVFLVPVFLTSGARLVTNVVITYTSRIAPGPTIDFPCLLIGNCALLLLHIPATIQVCPELQVRTQCHQRLVVQVCGAIHRMLGGAAGEYSQPKRNEHRVQ